MISIAVRSYILFTFSGSAKEALINSTNVMKGEAHGAQQPRHINLIGEGVSTAQRSNSLVQSINQRFLNAILFPSTCG